MTKIIVLRQMPRPTYAVDRVRAEPGLVRVHRDSLEASLLGGVAGTAATRLLVTEAENALVRTYVRNGTSVIVDRELTKAQAGKFADIAVEEGVDLEVIGTPDVESRYGIMKPYVPDPSLPTAVVVDIDGTLAHMNGGRSPYDYTKVSQDTLDENVGNLVRVLSDANYKIIVLSGREASCRLDTVDWLTSHRIPFDCLFMRKTGDNRRDSIIKYELFDQYIRPNYNVVGWIDDREQVVQMARNLGIKVYQVDWGRF